MVNQNSLERLMRIAFIIPENLIWIKLWYGNYIDMCSVIRKSLFDSIGMLDENPILIGHEDWEYWIRAGIENKRFFFIDEVVFEYRMINNSLITPATDPSKFEKMIQYIYGKNYKYFQKQLSRYNDILYHTIMRNCYMIRKRTALSELL